MVDNQRIYDVVDDDPKSHIRVALSLITLAYHNKNYLDKSLHDDANLIVELQYLLQEALTKMKKDG